MTMAAPWRSRGLRAWIWKYGPLTFALNVSSHRASDTSASGANRATPALMKMASSWMSCACSEAARRLASSMLPASLRKAMAPWPMSAWARARACSSRPVMTTRAPSWAYALAAARPMPLLPPVTRTVWLLKRCMMVPKGWLGTKRQKLFVAAFSVTEYSPTFHTKPCHAFGVNVRYCRTSLMRPFLPACKCFPPCRHRHDGAPDSIVKPNPSRSMTRQTEENTSRHFSIHAPCAPPSPSST